MKEIKRSRVLTIVIGMTVFMGVCAASLLQAADLKQIQAVKNDGHELTGYGLREILRLRPVTYIDKDNPGARRRFGFIPREVKQLIPELAEGQGVSPGIHNTQLVPVLVNAIKELDKKQTEEIDELRTEVEFLRSELDDLRAIIYDLESR